MSLRFNPDELRVLACLIEKRLSTPAGYPLTLKSLVTACNQSSNRDPVVDYDQSTVNGALKNTRMAGFSRLVTSAGARVPKFEEALCENLGLDTPQAAVMAELILRGPQTPGELRQRCSRMYDFPDLGTVDETLMALSDKEDPLVAQLPRQPGKREVRYAQLLSGPIEDAQPVVAVERSSRSSLEERVARLEEQMARVLELLEG